VIRDKSPSIIFLEKYSDRFLVYFIEHTYLEIEEESSLTSKKKGLEHIS
jgi:hypothetical protein